MAEITEPFADVDDLRARWPDMPPGADESAATLLLDASQFIVDAVPSAAEAAPLTLKRITCAVVRRSMQAPADLTGVESAQQSTGPFSQTLRPINPHGDFYLTSQEKRVLGFGRQVAFEVDLTRGGAL